MNRKILKTLSFKYDENLDEFVKKSENKTPMGQARVEFKRGDHRVGKLYWDEIKIVYGSLSRANIKPFMEIKTLNGFMMIISQDDFTIRPDNQMEDNCYIGGTPDFDSISFYGDWEWNLPLSELKKSKST